MTRRIMIDNWSVRHWLCWPWCAVRRHPATFWMPIAWNGVIEEQVGQCSCGRRRHTERCGPITTEQYYRQQSSP